MEPETSTQKSIQQPNQEEERKTSWLKPHPALHTPNSNKIQCLLSKWKQNKNEKHQCNRGTMTDLYATGSNGWKMLNICWHAGISSLIFSSSQYSFPFPVMKTKSKSLNLEHVSETT